MAENYNRQAIQDIHAHRFLLTLRTIEYFLDVYIQHHPIVYAWDDKYDFDVRFAYNSLKKKSNKAYSVFAQGPDCLTLAGRKTSPAQLARSL